MSSPGASQGFSTVVMEVPLGHYNKFVPVQHSDFLVLSLSQRGQRIYRAPNSLHNTSRGTNCFQCRQRKELSVLVVFDILDNVVSPFIKSSNIPQKANHPLQLTSDGTTNPLSQVLNLLSLTN